MPFRLTGLLAGKPVSFPLAEGRNLVGSAPGCRVLLGDPSVSRTHAELVVHGESVAIADLGSHNGTFVGSRRVQREALEPGADLSFGRLRLRLTRVEEAETGAVAEEAPDEGRKSPETTPSMTTLVARPDGGFAVEHLPRLLALLAEGADPGAMASATGAALAASLPVLRLEVRAGGREAVLFRYGKERAEETGRHISITRGDAEVRAVFANDAAVTAARPLLESGAFLVALAARPRSPG